MGIFRDELGEGLSSEYPPYPPRVKEYLQSCLLTDPYDPCHRLRVVGHVLLAEGVDDGVTTCLGHRLHIPPDVFQVARAKVTGAWFHDPPPPQKRGAGGV